MINQKTEHRHLLLLILSNPKMPCVSIHSREVSQNNHEGYSLKILDQLWKELKRFKHSLLVPLSGTSSIYLYLEQPRLANQFSFHGRNLLLSQPNKTIPMSTVDPRCSKTFSAISCRGRVMEQLDLFTDGIQTTFYVKKLAHSQSWKM